MGQFGNKFRKTREKKQLSLEDVSKVLKISARMLEAIEEENFDLLPGGIFNKGFIRSYARHLELDPEEAVADYLATMREAQTSAENALTESATARSGSTVRVIGAQRPPQSETGVEREELPGLQLPRVEDVRPRKQYLGRRNEGIPWSLIAAAAIVIVLGILLWIRHTRSTRAAAPVARNVSSAEPAAPPVAAQTPPLAPVPKSLPASPPHAAAPRQKPPAGPTLSATSPAVRTESARTAPLLSLTIRARENSWVSVQADGKAVLEETLIAPAHSSVRADKEIIVRVGNAAGVSFVFNGVELSPQGNESEVKTLIFDPTGMKLPP